MSSSTFAVAWNFVWSVIVPLKSNVGFLTAFLPSAPLRNATWAASCAATTLVKLVRSLPAPTLFAFATASVELRLEVLERQREVEDRDVARRDVPPMRVDGSAPMMAPPPMTAPAPRPAFLRNAARV